MLDFHCFDAVEDLEEGVVQVLSVSVGDALAFRSLSVGTTR